MIDPVVIISLHVVIELALIARVMLRPHREPASRIAWVAVIAGLPVFGMLAYLLLGEVRIGRARVARLQALTKLIPEVAAVAAEDAANLEGDVPARYDVDDP